MTATGQLREIVVVPTPSSARGFILAAGVQAPCAIGRAGTASRKREGDGATPVGRFRLVGALYRPDRLPRPTTRLPLTAIRPQSGWCDDPNDRAYNQPVELPYPASAEHLWRADHVYDLIIVLDYNLKPARSGAGSAIFLHLATPDYSPTAGCIAVSLTTMRRLLPRLGPETVIAIK